MKPENFLSKLREGLELTLDRFQGLEVQRFVPCPGHGNEKKCSYEFNYEHLLKALEKKRDKVECQEELVPVPLGKLLYGLHVSSVEQMLIDIDKDQKKLLAGQKSLSAGQQELLELTQRQFLSIYNREKDRDLGKCPYVFTLTPENSANWKKKLMGEKMTLHLYCQTPNCWHPVENGGKYPIDVSADWLDKMAPYVGSLTKMMKTYLPLAIAIGNTALGIPGPQIKIMQTALKVLPDIEETARYHLKNITEASDSEVTQFQGASLRPLREFLHQVDKEKHWGELRLHTTPEGHYYWLCPKHYEAMTKPHAGKP